jgi:hypothetical protein
VADQIAGGCQLQTRSTLSEGRVEEPSMPDALDTPFTLAATSIEGSGRTPYHVGVATRNIDEAMFAIGGLFSLEWAPIKTGAEPGLATPVGPVPWNSRVVHSRRGPMRFELLEGSGGKRLGDLCPRRAAPLRLLV